MSSGEGPSTARDERAVLRARLREVCSMFRSMRIDQQARESRILMREGEESDEESDDREGSINGSRSEDETDEDWEMFPDSPDRIREIRRRQHRSPRLQGVMNQIDFDSNSTTTTEESTRSILRSRELASIRRVIFRGKKEFRLNRERRIRREIGRKWKITNGVDGYDEEDEPLVKKQRKAGINEEVENARMVDIPPFSPAHTPPIVLASNSASTSSEDSNKMVIELRRSERMRKATDRYESPITEVKRRPRNAVPKAQGSQMRRRKRDTRKIQVTFAPVVVHVARSRPIRCRNDPILPQAPPPVVPQAVAFDYYSIQQELGVCEADFAKFEFGFDGLALWESIRRMKTSVATFQRHSAVPSPFQMKRLQNAISKIRSRMGRV